MPPPCDWKMIGIESALTYRYSEIHARRYGDVDFVANIFGLLGFVKKGVVYGNHR